MSTFEQYSRKPFRSVRDRLADAAKRITGEKNRAKKLQAVIADRDRIIDETKSEVMQLHHHVEMLRTEAKHYRERYETILNERADPYFRAIRDNDHSELHAEVSVRDMTRVVEIRPVSCAIRVAERVLYSAKSGEDIAIMVGRKLADHYAHRIADFLKTAFSTR